MSFNSSNIQIANLYTDQTQQYLTTDVYANGVMQAVVWVSINYNGSTDGIESQINSYVYNNTKILNTDGSPVTWTKSSKSNGFPHDINRASASAQSYTSDYRVPIYFTVPQGIGGVYYWYADLYGDTTSKSAPVTVNVHTITLTAGDIEIVDICHYDQCILRTFRYTHQNIPNNHFLVKWQYQGIKFNTISNYETTTYVAMMRDGYACAALLMKSKSFAHVALKNKNYNNQFTIAEPGNATGYLPSDITIISTSPYDWQDPESITQDDITKASSNGGLPIVCIAPSSHNLQLYGYSRNLDFYYDLIAQDNFGNWLKFIMDWDYGGDYHKNWAVTEVQVTYPD